MKYITEFELRQKYKEERFTDIVIPNETRLTPEAYQFLVDRRVQIVYQQGGTGSPPVQDKLEETSLTKEANILASETMLSLQIEQIENQLFLLQHESYQAMNRELSKDLQCLQDSLAMLKQALSGDDSVMGPLQLASEGVTIGESDFSILNHSYTCIHAALIGKLNALRLALKQLCIALPERFMYYDECIIFISCCILKVEHIITNVGGGNE